MKKQICVVTGARSEYGILQPVLEAILKSEKLDLSLLVTGMHLLEKFGYTINQIKESGVPIKKMIPMYDESDFQNKKKGYAVGKAIMNFTDAFNELNPDLLLVSGDRYEMLAAVIAASTQFIPIAHIHGGDNVSKGQIDEQIRHSITKFSHIHFPATQRSYERIKLLGEEEWRIHMVGSPSIDSIINQNFLSRLEICNNFGFENNKPIIICLQHPFILKSEKAGIHMKIILDVLRDLNLQTIIIYPNNDLGSELIIKTIQDYKNNPNFRIFKNLERFQYLSSLKNIDLLIGNSSSGFIESPIFKLPVVNIGNRNKGREKGDNIINVSEDYTKIKNAVIKGLSNKFKEKCQNVKNPFGEGNSSQKIVKILENVEINEKLLIKRLSYDI